MLTQGEMLAVAQDTMDSNLEEKYLSSDLKECQEDETLSTRKPDQIATTSEQGREDTLLEVMDVKNQGPTVTDFHLTDHHNALLALQSHQPSAFVVASSTARTNIIYSSDNKATASTTITSTTSTTTTTTTTTTSTHFMQQIEHDEIAKSNNTTKVHGGSGLGEYSDRTQVQKSDAIFGVLTSAHEAAVPNNCDMPPPVSRGDSFCKQETQITGDLVFYKNSTAIGISATRANTHDRNKHVHIECIHILIVWLILAELRSRSATPPCISAPSQSSEDDDTMACSLLHSRSPSPPPLPTTTVMAGKLMPN